MQISAVKFKATCLKLIDRVARTGEPVVITKRASDRIIVATARKLEAHLVTANTTILEYARATKAVHVVEI